MGRPKLISDSELLDIAFDVISHEGFDSFTFEQVSKAVKLSPAALVKRFKTKKRLALLARNHKWDQNLKKMNENEIEIEKLSGLSGIFAFLNLIAKSVDSKRLGEHAKWLGEEASDLRSRKKVAAYFEETRKIFKRLLSEAVETGELSKAVDPHTLSSTLEALVQGSIFQFAFLDKRSIREHLEGHFRVVLKAYGVEK